MHFNSQGSGASFMWHYHEYFELFAVLRNGGEYLIGDSMGAFSEGQIFLFGPRLPHAFYRQLPAVAPKDKYHALIAMFSLSENTFPEIAELRPLLEKASRGLVFEGESALPILKKLKSLKNKNGIRGILCLFDILADLNEIDDCRLIASEGCALAPGVNKVNKLDRLHRYLHKHYRDDIKLSEAAKHVHLSVSGLCAFFQRSTKRSVNSYIHELRISHACKLLIETDMPVTEIAFEAGYKTVSCFNRKFKDLRSCSPRSYRKKTTQIKA